MEDFNGREENNDEVVSGVASDEVRRYGSARVGSNIPSNAYAWENGEGGVTICAWKH